MKLRVGYELIYDCPQATPMILMLHIHQSRSAWNAARQRHRDWTYCISTREWVQKPRHWHPTQLQGSSCGRLHLPVLL